MYIFMYVYIYICIYVHVTCLIPMCVCHVSNVLLFDMKTNVFVCSTYIRPTQSMIYIHCLIARSQKFMLLIVQHKYNKSCLENKTLQDLILRTKLSDTGFISQHG